LVQFINSQQLAPQKWQKTKYFQNITGERFSTSSISRQKTVDGKLQFRS